MQNPDTTLLFHLFYSVSSFRAAIRSLFKKTPSNEKFICGTKKLITPFLPTMKKIILAFVWILFSCILSHAQNIGIGTNTPTEKLHVVGNIKANTAVLSGIKMASGAGAGKVLTSDAAGNASWQVPLIKISSVWKSPSDAPSRDTTIDGTLTKVYYVSAPELTPTMINTANVSVYFKVGGVGPYELPYISNAGGRANAIQAILRPGKIAITRPTFNETSPNNINLPATLEFRYTIIQ